MENGPSCGAGGELPMCKTRDDSKVDKFDTNGYKRQLRARLRSDLVFGKIGLHGESQLLWLTANSIKAVVAVRGIQNQS